MILGRFGVSAALTSTSEANSSVAIPRIRRFIIDVLGSCLMIGPNRFSPISHPAIVTSKTVPVVAEVLLPVISPRQRVQRRPHDLGVRPTGQGVRCNDRHNESQHSATYQ